MNKLKRDKSIIELFEKQASDLHSNIAIESDKVNITYGDLDTKANLLAYKLKIEGATKRDVIGIVMDRNIKMYISILAVMKVDCTFLPIDSNLPIERIKFMIDDCKADIIITDESKRLIIKDKNFININTYLKESSMNYTQKHILCKNHDLVDNAVYITYTSGTSGTPKGVVTTDNSIKNFIDGIKAVIDLKLYCSIVSVTTISFDMFIIESLMPLVLGMKVCLTNTKQKNDADEFCSYMQRTNAKVISTTPSKIKYYLHGKNSSQVFRNIEVIFLGGEVLTQDLYQSIREVYYGRIFNLYGPTEATIFSTIIEIKNNNNITIGKPIINTEIYIVDKDLKVLPDGETGEICISGLGISKGYINHPQLTAQKFVVLPEENITVYRTGDMGKYNDDRNLVFLGREDNQVKVRGHRIELDEIDLCIKKITKIKDSTSLVKFDDLNNAYIVNFYVCSEDIEQSTIREKIGRFLPDYMIPTLFIAVPQIPLNLNGKVDKNKLLKIVDERNNINEICQYSGLRGRIRDIMSDVLKFNKVDVFDNFFEVGGHSLRVAEFINNLRTNLNVNISLDDLYESPSSEELANRVFEMVICDDAKGYDKLIELEYGLKSSECSKIIDNEKINILSVFGNISKEDIFSFLKIYVKEGMLPHYIVTSNEPLIEELNDNDTSSIIYNIDRLTQEYNQQYFDKDPIKEYPLSPMQYINSEIKSQFSGLYMVFNEVIDKDALNKSIKEILVLHKFLTCTFEREKTVLYPSLEQIEIPMFDLSNINPRLCKFIKKQIVENYITTPYSVDSILHRLILLKENFKKYTLIMPINSIVYDGESNNILQRQVVNFYNNYKKGKEILKTPYISEFDKYLEQIYKGPNVQSESIINFYELEKYRLLTESIIVVNSTNEFYIEFLIKELEIKNKFTNYWEFTLYLVIELFRKYYNISHIPTALFVAGRRFEDFSCINNVGNYVTYIPTILEGEYTGILRLSEKILNQIRFAEESNIYFPAIIVDEILRKNYFSVYEGIFSKFDSVLMLGYQDMVSEDTMELYNLIGHQLNRESIENVGNRLIEVMCNSKKYRISFTGFNDLTCRNKELKSFISGLLTKLNK